MLFAYMSWPFFWVFLFQYINRNVVQNYKEFIILFDAKHMYNIDSDEVLFVDDIPKTSKPITQVPKHH